MRYNGIKIDLDRDDLLTDYSISLLNDFYMKDGEKSPQECFARASVAWSKFKDKQDLALAQRLYDYVSKKWFLFASPVLSNAPFERVKTRGFPSSCFLTYVPDTIEGLISHTSELRWLSIFGGGIGGHWSDVRTVSDIAPGPIPFLRTVDADMIAYRQGRTRKGSYAAYLDISHPDIIEFINIRIPTGDVQRKALNLHNAVNITDAFMHAVYENQPWNLMDPKDNSVKETIDARKLWERLLEIRFRTGEPYINFIDTANKSLPSYLKDKGLRINGSNLCNEIHLPTNSERTAVCCLSSLNLEYYDEWKNTSIVEDLITMLDNVLEYFIENAPDDISRAKFSAERERSIGLGAMGFHSYLQKKNVAWESESANVHNIMMFGTIKKKAHEQSQKLAIERGEYLDGTGSGVRNAHLLAIAPNASSGIILSTSPSIEPLKANAYTHRTRGGSFLVKNKYLEQLLQKKEINSEKIWSSIITNRGSVQHLEQLTKEEKLVFKTAQELDQNWVVRHAGDRQRYVCQGQSVNLFFPAEADKEYVNKVHLSAWERGLKGLYYLRTEAKARAETVAEKVERVALGDDKATIIYGKEDCPFCTMAKEELQMRNIPFEYVDLKLVEKTAAQVTGRKVTSVPQIYMNGSYIGGYEDMMKKLNSTIQQETGEECVACQG